MLHYNKKVGVKIYLDSRQWSKFISSHSLNKMHNGRVTLHMPQRQIRGAEVELNSWFISSLDGID